MDARISTIHEEKIKSIIGKNLPDIIKQYNENL